MARKLLCTCALGLFGLVAACSDPVAPAAQATASLYLTTVNPSICAPGPHWVNVPFAAGGGQQTTATRKGGLAVDGQDQAAISCSVKDNGGVFAVSASLRSPAVNPQTGMPVSPTNIVVSTTIAADQQAQGSVSIQDDKTTTSFTSTDDMGQAGATCMFSVHPLMMGDQLGIAPGRMWASVTCPRFRDPQSSNLNEACQVSPGYVVLENCSQ